MGHKRYLEHRGRFQRGRRSFNGTIEIQDAPRWLTSTKIYDHIYDITNVYGL